MLTVIGGIATCGTGAEECCGGNDRSLVGSSPGGGLDKVEEEVGIETGAVDPACGAAVRGALADGVTLAEEVRDGLLPVVWIPG